MVPSQGVGGTCRRQACPQDYSRRHFARKRHPHVVNAPPLVTHPLQPLPLEGYLRHLARGRKTQLHAPVNGVRPAAKSQVHAGEVRRIWVALWPAEIVERLVEYLVAVDEHVEVVRPRLVVPIPTVNNVRVVLHRVRLTRHQVGQRQRLILVVELAGEPRESVAVTEQLRRPFRSDPDFKIRPVGHRCGGLPQRSRYQQDNGRVQTERFWQPSFHN